MVKLPRPSKNPRLEDHIFISYSSKDRAFVDQLANELRRLGHTVWIDFEGIRGGEDWKQSIADGLHPSRVVLLVLSPESIISDWVEEEIRTAQELNKKIIPLHLRPLPESIASDLLRKLVHDIHYRDFTGGFQQPFEQLLEDLPKPKSGIPGHCQKLVAKLAALPWGLDHYIQEEAKLLPINASPYEDGIQRGSTQNLMQDLWNSKSIIVLGEPGVGKSVALERFAWELASQEIPILPIQIKLLEYDGQPLLEWIYFNLIEQEKIPLHDTNDTQALLKDTSFKVYFLLDGLNEVRPIHREKLTSEITRLAKSFPRHHLVVSSRIQDESWQRLRQGTAIQETVVVQAIRPEQVQKYLIAHLADDASILWQQLDERMRGLAKTPLFLWLIKEAWSEARENQSSHEIRMPDNRGELYSSFIKRLLRRDNERGLGRSVPVAQRLKALEKLALHLHEMKSLTLSHTDALDLIGDEQIVEVLLLNGFLVGEDELRFAPHQTIQEHFAARALLENVTDQLQIIEKGESNDLGVLSYANDPWWAETFIQMAGLSKEPNKLARAVADKNPWLAWWCVSEGRSVDDETLQAVEAKSIALVDSPNVSDRRNAAQALSRLQTPRVIDSLARLSVDKENDIANIALESIREFGEHAKDNLAKEISSNSPHSSPIARANVGRYLSELGDPRRGVGVVLHKGIQIPDIDWVEIPEGKFLYGDRKKEILIEKPYVLSKYLITNAQFALFIEEGYRTRKYWTKAGWESKENNDWTEPRYWQDVKWNLGNYPVVGVSWYEAYAYTNWLSEKLGYAVSLPTEHQWEKAARGTDGREFPWGDEWDENKCNNRNILIGQTSGVGLFPRGTSPYKIEDMSGNVDEWCLTEYNTLSNVVEDEDAGENSKSSVLRVLRGGSWADYHTDIFRTSLRNWFAPYLWDLNLGFRVAHLI